MPSCLIIDDEPLSRDVLRKYIRQVPDLEIAGECRNAMEAMQELDRRQIDILFLDINMPGLSGISFARSLTASPLIIFSTAYPEFAVEGFELEALDYLVKPYSFERFLKAVNRARDRLAPERGSQESERKMILKSDKKLYAVTISDILFVEGQGDYIRIFLEDKKLLVHGTIKNFVASLPGDDFIRIHKSYVVNLRRIDFIEGNRVRIRDHSLTVSPGARDGLMTRYGRT